jgi:preprotein translocase subunit SecG
MRTVLIILDVMLALAVMVSVLMQPSKSDGLKGLMAGNNESFFSRNKSRTKEAMLFRLTIVFSVLFAVVTVALNVVK